MRWWMTLQCEPKDHSQWHFVVLLVAEEGALNEVVDDTAM